MTIIKEYVDRIDEELNDSKHYAEEYVLAKSENDSYWMNRYREMAEDELRHSEYIHELAVKKIQELKSIMTPPAKMLERWEAAHVNYVDKAAWIKQMLSL